jgi:enoyl-CoA hydratase/carnithine racemase
MSSGPDDAGPDTGRHHAGVALQVGAGVATLTFGDPSRKNILTPVLLDAIPEALQEAVEASARVIVLRGRGRLWSAGYDIASIPGEIFDTDPEVVASHPFERCMRSLEECPVVTLAALRGAAFGGALELALSCDLRWAHEDCRFGLPPARLGIIYSHTGLQKLVRLVGAANARWLLFTAETVDAAEAQRIGLIQRAVADAEFEAAVERVAEQVAQGAPLAVQGMKRILQWMEAHDRLDDDAVQEILRLRRQAFESRDFAEGQRAFAEKRPPRFEGR